MSDDNHDQERHSIPNNDQDDKVDNTTSSSNDTCGMVSQFAAFDTLRDQIPPHSEDSRIIVELYPHINNNTVDYNNRIQPITLDEHNHHQTLPDVFFTTSCNTFTKINDAVW
jgi:hypothetical protein